VSNDASSSAGPPGNVPDEQPTAAALAWDPGHFYSPIPSLQEIRSDESRIFERDLRHLPGIELNERGQLALFRTLSRYYHDQPWGDHPSEPLRYFFDNDYFRHGEAILLSCMLRHLRPRRLIEVGCGFSSCAVLDVNELFFSNSIACTLIDPYPDVLLEHLRPEDLEQVTLLRRRVQDVETARFRSLRSGDIVMIDSSHVAKTGSDVNDIFFRILPALHAGVHVHFHDIHYPFEYPREWVYEGRSWNEAYVLRAFLEFNGAFRVRLFNAFLAQFHAEEMSKRMPRVMSNPGSSVWLVRTRHGRGLGRRLLTTAQWIAAGLDRSLRASRRMISGLVDES
jgi:hypothetical protein